MRIRILDSGGNALSTLNGISSEQEAALHLSHYTGAASWVEVDPAIVAAEQDEERVQNALLRVLLADRFDVENRIRVIEGKAAITKAQFISAVKAKLGI